MGEKLFLEYLPTNETHLSKLIHLTTPFRLETPYVFWNCALVCGIDGKAPKEQVSWGFIKFVLSCFHSTTGKWTADCDLCFEQTSSLCLSSPFLSIWGVTVDTAAGWWTVLCGCHNASWKNHHKLVQDLISCWFCAYKHLEWKNLYKLLLWQCKSLFCCFFLIFKLRFENKIKSFEKF